MASFPSTSFTRDSTRVRFQEEDTPAAINRRWLGMPRGVAIGFTPTVTSGSDILTLDIDGNHQFSLLRVGSQTERVQVTVFTDSPISLDFTGHTQFPVYVIARADYVRRVPTKATILTRTTTASGNQEVLICKVDKSGVDLVVESLAPTTRQSPVAFSGQSYGYMLDGAITDLAASDATVTEVAAARNSPYTGAQSTLGDRINTDLSGTEMANRLGFRPSLVLSNVHEDRAGTSANVSGSFAGPERAFEPRLTLEPGGSETVEGAITSSPRNVCFLIDAATGQRIVDTTTNLPVFGSLSFLDAGGGISGTVGAGKTIFFSNADTSVTGGGTNPFAVGTLEAGDIVLGPPETPDYPSGRYYEIRTIINDNEATLGTAFQGADSSVTDTPFRRFTLTFDTTAGGFTGILTNDIQFGIPSFFRLERAIFDGLLFLKKSGEVPEVEDATQTEAGKALIAIAGGEVGSFRTIKNSGATALNDAHTLNFTVGGATNAGGGVANVAVTGPTGPAGTSASQGPTGPSGQAGAGYSINVPFDDSPTSGDTLTAGGIVTLSHSVDFVTTHGFANPPGVVHLTGGWAGWPTGIALGGWERFVIDSLGLVSATEGRIEGRIIPSPNTSTSTIKLFLGASQ